MHPFFNHFGDFPQLRKFLEDKLGSEHKRIDQLLYSYLRIEYSSTIKKHSNEQLGLVILDYLNESVSLIAKYAGIPISIKLITIKNIVCSSWRLFS